MKYDVLINLPLSINLFSLVDDYGWIIVNASTAKHTSCNGGNVGLGNLSFQKGKQYKIKYTVSDYSSGLVRTYLGTQQGMDNFSNGDKEDLFTCDGNTNFGFYSDGDLTIQVRGVIELKSEIGTTIGYNESVQGFTSFYSYIPELMVNSISNFITFKYGVPYLHDDEIHSDNYNKFYNDHTDSEIVFVFNNSPEYVKTFLSIAINSTGQWESQPGSGYNGIDTSLGQVSTLLKDDFNIDEPGPMIITKKEGTYYANFYRDENSYGGLFEGDVLKGNWVRIRLTNGDENFVSLWSVFLNAV